MKFNIKLPALFKKTLAHKSDPLSNEIIRPVRHWAYALGFTTIAFISGASFFGYEFFIHLTGVEVIETNEQPSVEFKYQEAEKVLKVYREYRAEFERLRGEKSTYMPDPDTNANQEGIDDTPLADGADEQYSDATPINDILAE